MLGTADKQSVKNILDSNLGYGLMRGNEVSYHCPFCHHHKKKLQVNLEKQFWHCWVCNARGRSIYSLASKLDVGGGDLAVILNIYGSNINRRDAIPDDSENVNLVLPNEYIPLYKESASKNPMRINAIKYLERRGIGLMEIKKYMIGYCQDGIYAGMVVIPSFDCFGKLNYFIGRSYVKDSVVKYKAPPISKNIIFFESHINWNMPITVVEGVFDAISVKRNVIPLLGKFIQRRLHDKIYENRVSNINIFLDSDATKDALYHANVFMKNGIAVKNIVPAAGKDASDIGFVKSNELINNSAYSSWESIVRQKIQL